jgi:hypothetical protein
MPTDQEELDHYKIWEVLHGEADSKYDIIDQFHPKKALSVTLKELTWILNPVKKEIGKGKYDILHADRHLTGYRLETRENKPRVVKVTNQFHQKGVQWTLGPPKYLLVPAEKRLGGGTKPKEPKDPKINHFLCYEVTKAKALTLDVKLQDQFDKNVLGGRKENIYKLVPIYFGLPAKKGKEGSADSELHLAIYILLERPQIKISVGDQVGGGANLEIITNRYLAVPSYKQDLTTTTVSRRS